MTATAKAASNGSTKTTPALERLTGMARVLEGEAWRTASVMHNAAFEAEQLCSEIYRAVSDAYQPTEGDSHAATLAASPEIRDKAYEARRCLLAAVTYLNALIGDNGPPPF